MSDFRIAAAAYPIDFLGDWPTYAAKITRWIGEAADNGAALLVFPEYFSMELASQFAANVYGSLSAQLASMQTVLTDFIGLFAGLAQQHQVTICAGSFPVRVENGTYHNRSYLFFPDGTNGHQDKVQMTRFESEDWLIEGGNDVRVFETPLGKFGIAICYDAEFPLIARRMVELGADVILVPSCTDTTAGYWRVRIGCQARALENQCFVVQSSTVGDAAWSPAVDVNTGTGAVYTPVDRGFPDDGVLASGQLNTPGWTYADVNPEALAHVRRTGQVFNYRDWDRQMRILR
jgi:predicted amidohydrolase